jgi:hypothetical protein
MKSSVFQSPKEKRKAMGVLHIYHIQAGMELAEDIVSFNGATLLKSGSILTERHLSAFEMWGITEADIQGIDDDSLEEIQQDEIHSELSQKIASELDRLFQKTDPSDPITAELYLIRKNIKLKALMHATA